jgi:hypothetical protein
MHRIALGAPCPLHRPCRARIVRVTTLEDGYDQYRSRAHRGADRPSRARAHRSDAPLDGGLRAGEIGDAGRRSVFLPGAGSLPDLCERRVRFEGGRCRRKRVHRLPQRFRCDGRRSRPPGGCSRHYEDSRTGHALRGTKRNLGSGRRGVGTAVPAPQSAFLQLRDGSHDGCSPSGSGLHGQGLHRQDRRQLPRPPRRGDGFGQASARQARPARRTRFEPLLRRHPPRRDQLDPGGSLQRCRCPGATPLGS